MKLKRKPMHKPVMIRNAELAMKQAVAQVMKEHRQSGHPIAIWENGKVKWVKLPKKNGTKKTSR